MSAPRRVPVRGARSAPAAGITASSDSATPTCGHDHLVELYETEHALADSVHAFLSPALRTAGAAVIIATPEHRVLFARALEDGWVPVDRLVANGRLVLLDAAETLSAFMVDGLPDGARFRATIEPVLDRVGARGRHVSAYGEMVALLWAAGNVAAAIALEDLWNDLARVRAFDLLCAYPIATFEGGDCAEAFLRMCDQHTAVTPTETYSRLPDEDARQRHVARMQQESAALRGELDQLRDDRAALAELAYVDPLTGLANRRAFDRDLAREWALTHRDGVDSYVVAIDLDGFKRLNDEHGHAAGDAVLRHFASGLRRTARSTDVVARTGGDEFSVLMIRCDEGAFRSFLQRIDAVAASIVTPDGRPVHASVGTSSLAGTDSADDACDRADRAMYRDKRRRGGSRG